MAHAARVHFGAVGAHPSTRGGSTVIRVGPDLPSGEHLLRDLLTALADDPKGLVCDLSRIPGCLPPGTAEAVAAAGRQAALWPGVPVVVVCSEPGARASLASGPAILMESLHPALVALRAHVPQEVARLRVAPHPVAARAARDFVSRTCLDWGLRRTIAPACLVASDLVSAAMTGSTAGIEVSLRRIGEGLAVAVRGRCTSAPLPTAGTGDLVQPGPVVEALSSATGVLATADGQTLTWAVLGG